MPTITDSTTYAGDHGVDYAKLVSYTPNGPQLELHSSEAKYRLAWGGVGGGKSRFLLQEAIHEYALQFPGSASLLIRRNYPELKDGLIKDLLDTVPEKTKKNPNGLYTYNRSEHIATFINGSTIRFASCQNNSERDLAHFLSQAYVFIGFDELGQFSYEAWSFAGTRNRLNAGCKVSPATGLNARPTMAGATNPVGIGWKWIRDMFGCALPGQTPYQKRPAPQLKFKVPFDPTNAEHLKRYNPSDYHAVYSNIYSNPEFAAKSEQYIIDLEAKPPAERAKYLLGDPESKAGAYFSCFSYDRNVKSIDQIKFEPWQPRWMGSDWGLNHAWPTIWFTHGQIETIDSTPAARKWKQVTVIYRELVESELSYREMARLVASRTPQSEKEALKFLFFSPERFSRDGIDMQHTPSVEWGDHLLQYGMPRPSRASNERVAGATFLYSELEAGNLVVLDSCPKVISALQNVQRDTEKNLEDVMPMQGPEEYDVYDAVRYGFVSMMHPRLKPEAIRLQEELEKITDPTARFFYQHKREAEMRKKTLPIRSKVVPTWTQRVRG